MTKSHNYVLKKNLDGENVVQHLNSIWNLICSDMVIEETTVMRYGHGPNGMIGLILNGKANSLKEKLSHIQHNGKKIFWI